MGSLKTSWDFKTYFYVVKILLLFTIEVFSTPDDLKEICEDGAFEAKCAKDEIILMKEALYGRMRLGTCLSTNYGYTGCAENVISIMDGFCSGRRSCKVDVRDLLVEGNRPCPKDLRSYLEASYTCVKVQQAWKDCCTSQRKPKDLPITGNIASIVTTESSCGSIDCPWVIEAFPGQTINMSMYDFGVSSGEPPSNVCHVYAMIKDPGAGSTQTLCQGIQRRRHVYVSSSNRIELRMISKKAEETQAHFMLSYEVLGCPDPTVPSGGWLKRTQTTADIGCGNSNDAWRLFCDKNTWIGQIGNCTTDEEKNKDNDVWGFLAIPQGVAIGIVVFIAIFVGVLVIVIGVLIIKRNRASKSHYSEPKEPDLDQYGSGLYAAYQTDPNKLGYYSQGENSYCRTWQLHRGPVLENSPQISGTMVRAPQRINDTDTGTFERNGKYLDHVYESPQFPRRGTPDGVVSDKNRREYYELEPGNENAEITKIRQNPPTCNDNEVNMSLETAGDVTQCMNYR